MRTQLPSPQKSGGHSFRLMSVVARRSPILAAAKHLLHLRLKPQRLLLIRPALSCFSWPEIFSSRRVPKSATATAAWVRHVLSSRRCLWYILCIWYRRFEALAFCYQLGCDPGPTYRDVQLLFTSRSRTERRPCLNSLARPLNVSDVYNCSGAFKIEEYHRDHLCETSPRTVDFERRCTVYYYVSISHISNADNFSGVARKDTWCEGPARN